MSRPKGTQNKKKVINDYPVDNEKQMDPIVIEKQDDLSGLDYYIIVQRKDSKLMNDAIEHFKSLGYELQGGVSVTSWRDVNGIEFVYCQAMIRKE
jgi:hypothetical protein